MDKNKSDALREKRGQVWDEMRNLDEIADKFHSGSLPPEMQSKWDEYEAELNSLDQQIERADKMSERAEKYSKPRSAPVVEDTVVEAEEERTETGKEQELREAFRTYLRTGEERELRNLQADLDTSGGFTVPSDFMAELIRLVQDNVFMMQRARVFNISGGDVSFPRHDTRFSDPSWTAEIGTAPTDTVAPFGMVTLTPHKLAKLIRMSQNLTEDSAIDIEAFIREEFGYEFSTTMESAFMTGTGSGQPLGLFTASSKGISTSRDLSTNNTSSAIKFDNLIRQTGNIRPQYLARAQWIFHIDAVNQIRREKDGNGNYIWQPGTVGVEPNTILGIPYNISYFAPNTFTSGLYVGLLGDLSYYYIATKAPFRIQRLVELYAATDQIGFVGRMRADGMPVREEAFTRVKLG